MNAQFLTPLNADGSVRPFESDPVIVVRQKFSGDVGRVVGYDPRGYVNVAFPNPFLDGRESVLPCLPLSLDLL